MKKKVLLSSILTIALCLCLIAGSTFALFTSTSTVDISVKAANVEMEASLDNFKLYSVTPTQGGDIVDEFGGTYRYAEMKPDANTGKLLFANRGEVTFGKVFDQAQGKEVPTLVLDRITPGDKVAFDVTGVNKSDVSILYRYVIEFVSGDLLMKGLVVYPEGENATGYTGLKSYTSAWMPLEKGTNMENAHIVIELPVKANDDYQEQKVEITVRVEALQGNAAVTTAPHAMLWPSIFISLLMISFNLFGNGLRDAFNPSTRGAED